MKKLLQLANTTLANTNSNVDPPWEPAVGCLNCWKSSLISIFRCKQDWKTSVTRLRQVLGSQQANGMLPQLAYKNQSLNNTESKLTQPPIQAYALWKLYKSAPSKKTGLALLKEFYPKLLAQQRYFYTFRDPLEDGLITIYNAKETISNIEVSNQVFHFQSIVKEQVAIGYFNKNQAFSTSSKIKSTEISDHSFSVQDPVFNSIVTLANEMLIKIGSLIGEDVMEVILWNELTLHSINEKLWNNDTKLYQFFDTKTTQTTPLCVIDSLITLVGLVPDQEVAEHLMCNVLEIKNNKEQLLCELNVALMSTANFTPHSNGQTPAIRLDKLWLLNKGLQRYKLKFISKKLQKRILNIMKNDGFNNQYIMGEKDRCGSKNNQPSDLSASVVLDWLC